jgi:hypothetical protein
MFTLRELFLKLAGQEIHTDEVRVAVSQASDLLIEASSAPAHTKPAL